MKKIGIIGGGISGLYLANILKEHPEFDYKIFEKKESLDLSEGYGIQLSVNSIKILNKIGFKNLPVSEVFFPTKVNFFESKSFKKVCEIDLSQFNEHENCYVTLKRSTLIKFLLDNIPKDKIKYNTTLRNVENKDEEIDAHFSDNSEEKFDYIVISDGIFSKTKSIILNEDVKPKYSNSIALRGELNEFNIRDISIFMGSNFHYVIYPVNQNNNYNFVAILKKKLKKDEIDNENLFNNESFINSLKNILSNNSNLDLNKLNKIKAFPIFVSNKLKITKEKNIFLSGDALFALQPSFAQGASQSIETAHDIFQCINNKSYDLYEKRIKKINSINWRSKLNSLIFHFSNPFNIFIRNLVLKYFVKNKKFLENYLGKIYRS